MSLNVVISDYPKPYLNERVNNLTVDGTLKIDGEVIAAQTFTTNIQGSFVISPFSSNVVVSKIGAQVSLTFRAFNILNANQGGSGNLDVVIPDLPASYLPTSSMGFIVPFRGPDGGTISTRLQFDEATSTFQFYENVTTRTIFKAAGDVGTGASDISITWVRF